MRIGVGREPPKPASGRLRVAIEKHDIASASGPEPAIDRGDEAKVDLVAEQLDPSSAREFIQPSR